MKAILFIKRLKWEFWVLLLLMIAIAVFFCWHCARIDSMVVRSVQERIGHVAPALEIHVVEKAPGWQLFNVSGYCSNCGICVKKEFRNGRFASGKRCYFGGVAADRANPFGTKVEFKKRIHGLTSFRVEDRGRIIKGNKIDIWFPTHKEAKNFGRKRLYGRIVK